MRQPSVNKPLSIAYGTGELPAMIATSRDYHAYRSESHLPGDMIPIDSTPGVRNRMGFTIRAPRGVVCAITPYNSPLNRMWCDRRALESVAIALGAWGEFWLRMLPLARWTARRLRGTAQTGVPGRLAT